MLNNFCGDHSCSAELENESDTYFGLSYFPYPPTMFCVFMFFLQVVYLSLVWFSMLVKYLNA